MENVQVAVYALCFFFLARTPSPVIAILTVSFLISSHLFYSNIRHSPGGREIPSNTVGCPLRLITSRTFPLYAA